MNIQSMAKPLHAWSFSAKPRGVLTIFGALIFAGCNTSMDKGLNKEIEANLKATIVSSKKAGQFDIDISMLGNRKVRMICFQGPYMQKRVFEQSVGRGVEGFQPVVDDEYKWWLFYENGESVFLSVPRVAVADRDTQLSRVCFSSEGHVISVSCNANCTYTVRRK